MRNPMTKYDLETLGRVHKHREFMRKHHPDAVEVSADNQAGSMVPGLDAERFGEAIGLLIREMVEPLEQRITELEAGAPHGKKTVQRAGLAFKGAFQRALEYAEGDIVTHNDRVYVAVKDVPAGENLRDGMAGWVLMVKGAAQ